ncbi:MAG: GNAT family N-acetyltransferase, partial [Desertimonas sp.]
VPEMALVAEDDGRVVGHVMISGAVIHHDDAERADRPIVMLSPLAVAPDRHRQGIGGELVRAALALADQRGEPLVVLEGSPAYYPRFGFQPAVGHGITMPLPDWAPPEAAQVALLRTYDPADRTLRGAVIYPPAFDGLDA